MSSDSDDLASQHAKQKRLSKELERAKQLVLEKKGENSLLHAQLKSRDAKHSTEISELLALNAKTKEELQSEVARLKAQTQQAQKQLELMRSELRMANLKPKRAATTREQSLANTPTVERSASFKEKVSASQAEAKVSALGGDGFIVKRKRIAPSVATGPTFPTVAFSQLSSQPLPSGNDQTSQAFPFSQAAGPKAFDFQKVAESPAFAAVYDEQFENAKIGELLLKASSNGSEGLMDAAFTILNGGPPLAALSHLLKIVSDLLAFTSPPVPTLVRLVEQWIKSFCPFPLYEKAKKRHLVLLECCDCYFLSATLRGLDVLRVAAVTFEDLTDTWAKNLVGCEIQSVRSRAVEILAKCGVEGKHLEEIPDTQLFPSGPHLAIEEMFGGLLDSSSKLTADSLIPYSTQYFRLDLKELESINQVVQTVYYELLEASTLMARMHNFRSHGAILDILANEVDHVPPNTKQKRVVQACVAYFWLFTNSGNNLGDYGELVVCLGKITYGREYGIVATAQARSLLLHYINNPNEMDELAESMGVTTLE